MKWLLCISILCFSANAAAVRIRAQRIEGGNVVTSHGTAYIENGKAITALHVVAEGEITIETDIGWIAASIEKSDKDFDIAILKPRAPVNIHQDIPKGTVILASARSNPVVAMPAEIVGSKSANCAKFDHGCSGAPLFKDGIFIGICTHIGAGVTYVPAVLVRELLK